ncbi:ISL3 family transposase [Streptomyces sp. NPDC057580]|uniref:ISL3 family transposase n=1 Tax=Streptomyces sp. NPDC057580 TaxID=3346173 RepID=UPI0036A9A6E4
MLGRDPERELASFVLPEAGQLAETGDRWRPFVLLDADGVEIEPVAAFFAELLACDKSAATIRSYGMDLLRWWRFLWGWGIAWDRAVRSDARARKRLTTRLRAAAGAAVADQGRTVVQAARDYALSWPVVAAAFTSHARAVLPAQPEPVQALGIDEIRRGQPRWIPDEATGIWQTAVDRWHVDFVDLSGKQGLLGQVEGRTAQAVIDWLADRDQAWRDAVQYVAIDMCTIFKSAIRRVLPQATLVVDHFHLVQLANQTLTEVRRRVTVTHRGRRGRKDNREWELRNRLTRSAARMRGEHVDALLDELSNLPRVIGAPITVAWNAKEDLLDLLATARTRPDREQVRDVLYRFYRRCADADLPELQRLATTVETWWPEILAFLHTGITNAGSEGTNRVIKTIARDAYGFRNPGNQRLRTRCATTRRARGHLDAR